MIFSGHKAVSIANLGFLVLCSENLNGKFRVSIHKKHDYARSTAMVQKECVSRE